MGGTCGGCEYKSRSTSAAGSITRVSDGELTRVVGGEGGERESRDGHGSQTAIGSEAARVVRSGYFRIRQVSCYSCWLGKSIRGSDCLMRFRSAMLESFNQPACSMPEIEDFAFFYF